MTPSLMAMASKAFIYLPFTLFLFLGVLFFPGLAFFPTLIETPLLASAIPIISLVFTNLLAVFLLHFNIYSHMAVTISTLGFAIIALTRLYCRKKHFAFSWKKTDFFLLLFNISLFLPLLPFSGIHMFTATDALGSWNFWGLSFYHGQIPNTLGYPPFFPLFISYAYHLFGTTEYQGPLIAVLPVFPFCVLNAIAFSSKETSRYFLRYLLLIGTCVFPMFFSTPLYHFYTKGFADPLLAAAATLFIALLIAYWEDRSKKIYLAALLCCGICASLAKQPGLFWIFVSYPLFLLMGQLRQQHINRLEWLSAIVLTIPATIWFLKWGNHFYQNTGVMLASLHQSSVTTSALFDAFIRSVHRYFIQMPNVFLLFALLGVIVKKASNTRWIILLFILPNTLLWLLFGSYDIRLGLYLLGSAGVIIAAENYFGPFPKLTLLSEKIICRLPFLSFNRVVSFFAALSLVSFLILSFSVQKNSHLNLATVDPLRAGKSEIYHYFGNEADFIYKHIYNHPEVKVWANFRMIQSIFYGKTFLVPLPQDFTPEGIYANLSRYQPDYIFIGLCGRPRAESDFQVACAGPCTECEFMKNFMQKYPGLLIKMPMQNARDGDELYRLNKSMLRHQFAKP